MDRHRWAGVDRCGCGLGLHVESVYRVRVYRGAIALYIDSKLKIIRRRDIGKVHDTGTAL